MDLGADSEHDLAGKNLLRHLANPGTCLVVVLNRLVKGIAQAFHHIGMKTHPVTDAGDPAAEDAVIVILLDAGRIALVAHRVGHGINPVRCRSTRAARTL